MPLLSISDFCSGYMLSGMAQFENGKVVADVTSAISGTHRHPHWIKAIGKM